MIRTPIPRALAVSFLLAVPFKPPAALGDNLTLYPVQESYAPCPLNTVRGWHRFLGDDTPNFQHNSTGGQVECGCCTWQPHELTFHPGPDGERSVLRWTAPSAGTYTIDVTFGGRDPGGASTNVHVLRGVNPLFDGNVVGFYGAPVEFHSGNMNLSAGETIDFVVGDGGNDHFDDTTAIDAQIRDADTVWNAASDFSTTSNPAGAWRYGWSVVSYDVPSLVGWEVFVLALSLVVLGSILVCRRRPRLA
jgi:hypothetical protein